MSGLPAGSDVPSELKSKLKAFDAALNDVESKFTPLLNVPQNELSEQIPTLDKAKLDLVAAYSINSLFWMYLNVCGVNPKNHGLKEELERIRGYMNRVKEIQEKVQAPSVDVKAAKRFVKSALWEAAHKDANPETATDEPLGSKTTTASSSDQGDTRGKKRKGKQHQGKGKGSKPKSGRYTNMNVKDT